MIPPYVSYRTFRNFLELLKESFPSRIDRSVWGPRYSGTSGQQLMTALKVLGLIDEKGVPYDILGQLVNGEGEKRRVILRNVLVKTYAPIFEIDLKKATKAQFHELFRKFDTKEGVIVKCEAFFVQACQDAGIELSTFILARRHKSRKSNVKSTRIKSFSGNEMRKDTQEFDKDGFIVSSILKKYPEFDPAWDPKVQEKWLEGMIKLYEGLSSLEHNFNEATPEEKRASEN